MKATVYPADSYGCGHYRMIWPGRALRSAGYDVDIVEASDRSLSVQIQDDHVISVDVDPGTDVMVFQRITHRYLAEAIPIIRAQGVAVVVDLDDDLTAIHPSNPAWDQLHPRNENKPDTSRGNQPHRHSWHHLAAACRAATLVTVSTPALVRRYAQHGRYRVLYNRLPDHHYAAASNYDPTCDVIGWPASLHSHPDDPQEVGPAISRLVGEGSRFVTVGDPRNCGRAFGIGDDPPGKYVEFDQWSQALSRLGIGITPLTQTAFNDAKSWLKPLELAGAGVPWVGSPRVEYQRLHVEGCGRVADRPKDWYRQVQRLVRSESLRRELSESGIHVAGQHRMSDHAWRWWEAWVDAVDLERSGNAGQPQRDRVVAGASPARRPTRRTTPFRLPLDVQPAW